MLIWRRRKEGQIYIKNNSPGWESFAAARQSFPSTWSCFPRCSSRSRTRRSSSKSTGERWFPLPMESTKKTFFKSIASTDDELIVQDVTTFLSNVFLLRFLSIHWNWLMNWKGILSQKAIARGHQMLGLTLSEKCWIVFVWKHQQNLCQPTMEEGGGKTSRAVAASILSGPFEDRPLLYEAVRLKERPELWEKWCSHGPLARLPDSIKEKQNHCNNGKCSYS